MGSVFYVFQTSVWLDEKDSYTFWRKIRQLKYNLIKTTLFIYLTANAYLWGFSIILSTFMQRRLCCEVGSLRLLKEWPSKIARAVLI